MNYYMKIVYLYSSASASHKLESLLIRGDTDNLADFKSI